MKGQRLLGRVSFSNTSDKGKEARKKHGLMVTLEVAQKGCQTREKEGLGGGNKKKKNK